MKKSILLTLFVLGTLSLSAQTLNDAYRYSKNEMTGTARFMAMSGAFGALGGDISAININPASSAVFLSSSASASLDYRWTDNNLNFNGSLSSTDEQDFDIGNLGGVFVFNNNGEGNWRKISVGLNYQSSANYDDNYYVRGNSSNSIDQYFLNYAQGIELDLLQTRDNESVSELYSYLGENVGYGAQQALLGYQAYVIEADADDPANTSYYSLIQPGSFDQGYQYLATGLNGKLSLNIGTQFKDFLYLGLNINSHFINYENRTEFSEFNSNTGSETTEVYFGNSLSTNGDGFSFQLGSIAKLSDNVRVGLTYNSPEWYNIREENSQYLDTNSNLDEYVSIDPNVINVYPEYQYKIPSKISAGAAYLFGKSGLISFDYSFQDYTNMEFRPTNDSYFSELNSDISNEMKAVSTYKIGGEYRIQNFSLRGGYRFEESPFVNENRVGNLTGYSAGLGYNFGNVNLDLAYSTAQYDENLPVFESGYTNPVNIDRNISRMVLTLSFGL